MFFAQRFDARTCRQVMAAVAAIAFGSLFVNKPASAQTSSWTTCAQEGQQCSFSGTRNVRYGANGSWTVRQISASGGGVQCSNSVFGDPAPGTVKTCQLETVTTTTTTSWTHCASEGALCSFTGTRRVRYGADSRWVTRDISAVSGGVQCSNSVFGDPAPGTRKNCQLAASTTTSPTPSPTPTPTPTPTGWAFCANENALCSFSGTRRVRYGADTRWVTRDVTASNGGVQCSNAVFGDPASGTVKRCELAATTTTTQQPPTLSGTPATSVGVGSTYRFQPTASDPNGDTLAYTITNRPSWATFNTTSGLLTGQPTLANVGTTSNISISVSDGTTRVSLPTFSISVVQASSGAASLSWMPPTSNTDGSALTNLAGYRIYYGTSANALTQMIQVPSAGVSSYVVTGLSSGTYYFGVRAYSTTGAESDYSNLATKTIP